MKTKSTPAVTAPASVTNVTGTLPTDDKTNGASTHRADTPGEEAERESAYTVAQAQFDTVADFVDLNGDLRLFLRTPPRELIVHSPLEMDEGQMQMFTGFRVHGNMAKGPTKGGTRYHPDVSLAKCRALAMWMI